MDFDEVKCVSIVDVCLRYGLQLKFKGLYASARCPLPTHKKDDKERKFSVHVEENYWRCWSGSCNANNGGKQGGDVISLVALLEGCSQFDAAKKLVEWYGVKPNGNPPPKREEKPAVDLGGNLPEAIVKGLPYMQQVEQWWAKLRKLQDGEGDEEYEKRVLNGIKSELLKSYRNGKNEKKVQAS